VEAVAAGARAGGVGIVDREALLFNGVNKVDGRAHQVRRAHPIGDNIDAAESLDDVALEAAIVEEQLVSQPRAAAWLHSHAKRKVIAAFSVQERLDLGCRTVGQDDAVSNRRAVDGLFGCCHGCHSKGDHPAVQADETCAASPSPGASDSACGRRQLVLLDSATRIIQYRLTYRVRRLDAHGAHLPRSDDHLTSDQNAWAQNT